MGKLYEDVIAEYGKQRLRDMQIPIHIRDNINKELRPYQIDAIKNYLANSKTLNKNHLMFNMATGSGKTLVMAALMLDCYKKGYRNFVFFVNSTSILEKTKANFCDKESAKYLFRDKVIIESQNIEIRSVDNFAEDNENAINIAFNTIQGLHSLFNDARENSLTYKDLEGKKIVFLADEAHHLNADTKNAKLSKEESAHKKSWENTIKMAFGSNTENLLFEFSATIPKDENVEEFYRDKIVFAYDLKRFYEDRYSKKIFLIQYDDLSLNERFLGACVLSVFRQLLARDNGISLKPVVLFKSGSIKHSQDNEMAFYKFLEKLDSQSIKKFFENIDKQKNELLSKALRYLESKGYLKRLEAYIKAGFQKEFCINMNKEDALVRNQILINTLEDRDNHIRAIFAVDKLNEGWDVLNLFDIVRLDSNKSKGTATKEAQLIGRGARYFPFSLEGTQEKFQRKFDANQSDLEALEALTYHTYKEVEYIRDLHKALEESGLQIQSTRKRYTLTPQERAKSIAREFSKDGGIPLMVNRIQRMEEGLLKENLGLMSMPLISNQKSQQEAMLDKSNEEDAYSGAFSNLKCIETTVFLKAMQKEGIDFERLKKIKEVSSKREFIEKHLQLLECRFHKKQEYQDGGKFDRETQLKFALFVVRNLKEILQSRRDLYRVKEFEKINFKLKEREVWKEIQEGDTKLRDGRRYPWLAYDKFFKDSNTEVAFLDFIESISEKISQKYDKWLIVRNELFAELKIYKLEDNPTESPRGFFPDFVFWGKNKGEKPVIFQCFVEVKGEHLIEHDKWKEEVLRSLQRFDESLVLKGVGFYTDNKDKQAEFQIEFSQKILGE